MRIEESLSFDAAPEAVWPWISTPERLSQWISDVERFELLPAGDLAAGSRFVAHLRRSRAPLEARVEAVDPGRHLVLRASGMPNDLEVVLSFDLIEQRGGSLLTVRAETHLTGLLVFGEKLIASKARDKLAGWTGALRARLGAE